MANREQIQRSTTQHTTDATVVAVAAAAMMQTHDLDSLLDEIDGVLETNAEEFVRSYVQKGGQ
jgi:ubiquitin-like protein Pup